MTDADFFWKLIAGLSMLANFLGALALLWRRVSGKPEAREIKNDPLNVREADRFVTEKELKPLQDQVDGHSDDLAALRKEVQSNYNTLMTSDAKARSIIHQEINGLSNKISKMQGVIEPFEGLAQQLTRDIGRLEGILQRRN